MRNRQWKHGTTASGLNFSSPGIAHGRPVSTGGSPGIMDGRLGITDGSPGSTRGRPDLAQRRPKSGTSSAGPASPAPQSAAALQARRNGLAPHLQKSNQRPPHSLFANALIAARQNSIKLSAFSTRLTRSDPAADQKIASTYSAFFPADAALIAAVWSTSTIFITSS